VCVRSPTPSQGIEGHIDIQHARHNFAGEGRVKRSMIGACGRWRVRLQDGADDKEQRTHTHGGDEERPLSAKGLDAEKDEYRSGNYFDDACMQVD
jgi:hypothetical protein